MNEFDVDFAGYEEVNLTVGLHKPQSTGQEKPIVSSLTQFKVSPKINLNPGQVLPVALGMPILLLALMLFIQYRRSVKIKA